MMKLMIFRYQTSITRRCLGSWLH